MSESRFGQNTATESDSAVRQPIGLQSGRYAFFKVRRYGKLHFEKRIADAFADDLQTREALRKEFEIGYGLEHPAIVRYLDYADGVLYEEFIDGLTLREMLGRRDCRLADATFLRKMCRQLLEALDYLHNRGILHLDIKPENVMISNIGGGVKLVDLGSARRGDFERSEGFTPEYMAPEQGGTQLPTNVETDIYLVGRLMSELTSDAAWQPFIARATAPYPAGRFRNCREAIAAIPKAERRQKESKGGGCLRLIAFIAVIAAVAIWWSGRSNYRAETAADTEFQIGAKLLRGNPTAEEQAQGMKWMLMAAENGSTDAQCYMGFAYRDGIPPLAADTALAIHWFSMAAHKGDTLARAALAELQPRE